MQIKIIDIDKDIKTIDTRLINITNDKGMIDAAISNLQTELQQLEDNYEQNKIEAAEIKRQNNYSQFKSY